MVPIFTAKEQVIVTWVGSYHNPVSILRFLLRSSMWNQKGWTNPGVLEQNKMLTSSTQYVKISSEGWAFLSLPGLLLGEREVI